MKPKKRVGGSDKEKRFGMEDGRTKRKEEDSRKTEEKNGKCEMMNNNCEGYDPSTGIKKTSSFLSRNPAEMVSPLYESQTRRTITKRMNERRGSSERGKRTCALNQSVFSVAVPGKGGGGGGGGGVRRDPGIYKVESRLKKVD